MKQSKAEIFLKLKLEAISQRKNVIDVGGGGGFAKGLANFKELFNNSNYRSFDLPGSGADIEGDIHHIPLESESEDAVICNAVLEHVVDPIRAVQEIHRILKPGGLALIQVPSIYPYHANKGYGDYWRFFQDSLEYMFKDFSKVEIQKQGGFFVAMSVFLPFDKRRSLSVAAFLDRLFKTEDKRRTTRGFYLFAVK